MPFFHGERRWTLPARNADWLVVSSMGDEARQPERNHVPDVFVTSSLDHWLTTPVVARTLYAMYQALGGAPALGLSGPERGRYEQRLKQRLTDAFTRGELVALEVQRPTLVPPPWPDTLIPLPSEKPIEEPTWLAIALKEEDGKPVPHTRYVVTLPDGSTREGVLDKNGYARVDGVNPGKCQVAFPDVDGQCWS